MVCVSQAIAVVSFDMFAVDVVDLMSTVAIAINRLQLVGFAVNYPKIHYSHVDKTKKESFKLPYDQSIHFQ